MNAERLDYPGEIAVKRLVLAVVDRLDDGDCRRCGAPAEERHADCWRTIFDRLRDWCERAIR